MENSSERHVVESMAACVENRNVEGLRLAVEMMRQYERHSMVRLLEEVVEVVHELNMRDSEDY